MIQYVLNYTSTCKEIRVKFHKEQKYEHVPKPAAASQEGKVTILQNQQQQTDRTIPNNKPDTIIRNNGKGT